MRVLRLAWVSIVAMASVGLIGCASGRTESSDESPAAAGTGDITSTSAASPGDVLVGAASDFSGAAQHDATAAITKMVYFSGTSGAVENAIPGGTDIMATAPYAATPVYALFAVGGFRMSEARIPLGASLPTGAVMYEIVRADNGRIISDGLLNAMPDLSGISEPTPISS